MEDDDREQAYQAALEMLDIFQSVRAHRFDLTITSAIGEKIRFRSGVSQKDLRQILPALLDENRQQGRNIILRPRGPQMQFVQLDDLDADSLTRIEPAAFLMLETSSDNFQAWIALWEGENEQDFARRLRKGSGADINASGATRIAGSYNFKPKHAPDFPQVRIAASNPGHIVTREQLQAAGLVAAPELPPARVSSDPPPRRNPGSRAPAWPSYQKCLDGAPPNHAQTGPDASRADFVWCLLALDWGFSLEQTAARLLEESQKARKNGARYANLTAVRAAEALARRASKPHNAP